MFKEYQLWRNVSRILVINFYRPHRQANFKQLAAPVLVDTVSAISGNLQQPSLKRHTMVRRRCSESGRPCLSVCLSVCRKLWIKLYFPPRSTHTNLALGADSVFLRNKSFLLVLRDLFTKSGQVPYIQAIHMPCILEGQNLTHLL